VQYKDIITNLQEIWLRVSDKITYYHFDCRNISVSKLTECSAFKIHTSAIQIFRNRNISF